MTKWEIIHRYRHLADIGKVDYLKCSCGNSLINRLGPNDDPALYCGECNVMIQVGLGTLDYLESIVKSYEERI